MTEIPITANNNSENISFDDISSLSIEELKQEILNNIRGSTDYINNEGIEYHYNYNKMLEDRLEILLNNLSMQRETDYMFISSLSSEDLNNELLKSYQMHLDSKSFYFYISQEYFMEYKNNIIKRLKQLQIC